ncbi:MAG: hypothetical protein IPH84_06185 [Bacteroidales bacterium]|nr:hypothetical protein [Bacteroidales bacterium]
MKINKDNYEAYFLDYFEGNLSPSEVSELMSFMDQNPELKSEFEGFESITVVPDANIQFDLKDSLKKNAMSSSAIITADNIDDVLIAEIEGLLSTTEKNQLEEFLKQNPAYLKDQVIYSLSKLSPDNLIIFSQKESLLHKVIPFGSVSESNYEEILISEQEGILTSEMSNDLTEFLVLNPHIEYERKLYAQTRLTPDTSIKYQDKAGLKHKTVSIRRIVFYTLATAASLALLISISNFLNPVIKPTILTDSNQQKTSTLPQEKTQVNPVEQISNQVALPAQTAENKSRPIVSKSDEAITSNINSSVHIEKQAVRNPDIIPSMNLLASHQVESHDVVEPEFKFIRTSQMHFNDYLELYYNLKLSEQIQYAEINSTDKDPEKKLFNSFTSRIGEYFAFNGKKKTTESSSPISVWTFAELGVKTYNTLTQDNVKLDLQRDDQGKVVNYNLYGDKLELQRDIKK